MHQINCSVTKSNEITALWRYYCKYNRDGRVSSRYRWVDIEQTQSQVIQTVFKTSNDDDGLVVSATEKVIIRDNAPQMQMSCEEDVTGTHVESMGTLPLPYDYVRDIR